LEQNKIEAGVRFILKSFFLMSTRRLISQIATVALVGVNVFAGGIPTYATSTIANASFETAAASDAATPEGWSRGDWGTNQTVFAYPVTGYNGGRAAKVTMSSYSSGDAKWYFDDVPVSSGDVYTFTDRYQSDVPTDVTIRYHLSNGSYSYVWLASPPASATSWGQVSASFTVPSNATSLTIFHNIHAVGSLTVDEFALTGGTTPPPPPPPPPPTTTDNLIPNASFSSTAPGDATTPAYWHRGGWGANSASFSYPVTGVDDSTAAKVSISSYANGDAKWYSDDIPVTSGETYYWSERYQSSVSTDVTIQYHLTSGSYSYAWLANIPASAGNWGTAKASFTVPSNVVSLSIFHSLSAVGNLTIDDVSLIKNTPPPPPTDDNLLPNPTLVASADPSTPSNWHRGGWGTNQNALTYPATGYNGGKGLKTAITSFSNGDAKWYFDPITAIPGDLYEYSEQYQATVPTVITAQFELTNGSLQYQDLLFPTAASSWTPATVRFSAPQGTKTVTIFHLLNRVGTLTTSAFSLKHVASVPISEGMVSFTLDDGFSDVYTAARPIFNAAGIKPTLYIVSNFIGQPDYMTLNQIKTLNSEGYEIGGHTRNHLDLTTLTSAQLQSEVSGGRTDLLNLGFTPVTTFAYPLGAYNATVVQAVKNAGYVGARSVNSGFNDKASDRYVLMDQHIEQNTTVDQVKAYIDQAVAQKKWLILEMHNQSATGDDQYHNDPAVLQGIVDYVKQHNVKTVTISQGLQILNQ
jgi:peptidoglycan/xylan/chitin deacetylase (PgdA/CDA1 family)